MMFPVIFFALIQQIYGSTYTIRITDVDLNCVKESKKISLFPIQTLSFNIWNNQLSIPGTLDLSLSFNVTRKLSNDIQFSTKLERKLGLAWIDLPCLAGIGACDKQSLCNLMQQVCKTRDFNRSNNQDNKKLCSCEMTIGTYTIEHVSINIKRKKSAKLIKPITTGQYRFKVKFFEVKTKTTLGCVIGYLMLSKSNNIN